MNNFQQKLIIGKSGEEVVAAFFRKRGITVEDVSEEQEYQKKDIDFLLTNKQGQKCSVEVKTDYKLNKTGNLFFEGVYHKDFGDRKGWYEYCEADYLVFFDAIGMKLYIYDYKEGKELISNRGQFKYFYNKDDNCNREAYLLPICVAKQFGKLQIFDLAS